MHALLIWAARLGAVCGVILIVAAAVARLGGVYSFAGFQTATVLQGGMAAALLACLAYVATLAERR